MESQSDYSTRGCLLGKTVSPRLQQLEDDFMDNGGCFKEYRVGDLFYVKGNPQLNKESFTFSENGEYPYFTRTVFNNGIYDYANYLDQDHLIKGNSLAVGMMACKFFYMEHDFYAGQFTKTCYPRFQKFNEKIATYFISLLNCYSDKLKGVLVRDFESTFYSIVVDLPSYHDEISFDYMESYIRELEQERIRELDAYLKATGLNDYELTPEEKNSIEIMSKGGLNYKEFKIGELFYVHSSMKKFNANSVKFGGKYPYVARGSSDNGIRGYITENLESLNKGNTLSIGQDTGTVYYQKEPYFTGDKIKIAELKEGGLTELRAMYLITSIRKKFGEFRWGQDSFNEGVIKSIPLLLPINQSNEIDYNFIEVFSKAIEKLSIRSVVEWKDRIIETTKNVVNC